MTLSLALTTLAATVFATALIVALGPLLRRYALARPNARSSHETPTPQGGGIAVLGGAVLAIAGAGFILGVDVWSLAPALAAAAVLAVVGAVDDIRLLPAGPRLALQAVAVAAVVLATGPDVRIVPALPQAVETAALVLAVIWFVNLVNFMDGLDWMTVAEVVPVTACSRGSADRRGADEAASSRRRCSAPYWASRLSTSPWPGSFSATSARCPSGCWPAGCC